MPYQSDPPTEEESARFSKKRSFFQILERIPRFEVRKGKLASRGKTADGRPLFQQKRVDVLLAVDLVSSSLKHVITHAAIITGDSDFLPAITIAKTEGVVVQLFHGDRWGVHNELWETADERIQINKDFIDAVRR